MANKRKTEGAETALVVEKSVRAAPPAHLSIESAHSLLGAFSGVLRVFRNQHGRGFLQIDGDGIVYDLDGPEADVALLRRIVPTIGVPRPQDLRDVMDKLRALARVNSDVASVWLRVAPTADGVVIDVADVGNMRIWVTGDGVEIRNDQTGPLFYRTATMQPLTMPAETGDIEKLRPYINLPDAERWLLIGWLTYVLCHPRMASVAFPILLLLGDQGSGKSFLCRLIRALLDPGAVTVQSFPRSERDFAVAVQGQHLSIFDNVRYIPALLADVLCQVATGSFFATRRLYTNRGLEVMPLHGAVVLNSVHPNIIDQSDLAQRCLPLWLKSLDEGTRQREDELSDRFQEDLPVILRGLLDLGSAIMRELPHVEPQSPERLIGFSHWLAGMAAARGAPLHVFETEFGEVLHAGIRASLEEQPLLAAAVALMDRTDRGEWSGTPTQLLVELSSQVARRVQYSSEWPQNAISLSKRLLNAQRALQSLGIDVQVGGRGKERQIVLRRAEEDGDE